jgi:hypothetical protein
LFVSTGGGSPRIELEDEDLKVGRVFEEEIKKERAFR